MTDTTMNDKVPEKISYNDVDEKDFDKRPVCKEGWIKAYVRDWKKGTSKNGHLRLTLNCLPLKVDEEGNEVASKPMVPLDLYIPATNPARPGHKAPNTSRGIYFFATSIDEDFPRYCRKSEKDKGMFIMPTGEVVDLMTRNQISDEVHKAVKKVAVDWWNDPDLLKEETFYAFVEHRETPDGNVFVSIARTRSAAPDDDEVMTDNFTA